MGIPGEIASDPSVSPLTRPSFRRRVVAAFLRMWGLWLIGLLLLTLPPLYNAVKPKPDDPPPSQPDPAVPSPELLDLTEALRRGDDNALLDFFRRRRLSIDERVHVQSLLDQLGDGSFLIRENAVAALVKFGPRAAGMLRRAARHPDAEIAERARQVLARDTKLPPVLALSVALGRIEGRDNGPPDTVAILLDYLPDAATEEFADKVRAAIAELGLRDGRPDAALVAALTDQVAEKRAAAGSILAAVETHRPAVLNLLADADADVRRRIALSLLPLRQKASLPVLIDLLPELDTREAYDVLDLLFHVAGAAGPAVGLGIGEAGRQRCRDLWREWWRTNGVTLDLAKLPLRLPGAKSRGATLVVQIDLSFNRGAVQERGANGDLKREVESLGSPVWAEALADGHILVVEYRGDRVSERGKDGEEVWGVSVDHPLFAQRLADGSTFIAARDALWIADRAGSPRLIQSWPERIVATARRCPDGQTVVLTVDGTCLFLDAIGKEVRRFETGCKLVLAPGIDVTANKRVLVPDHAGQRILEFSPEGELLWQAKSASPVSVQRLADGNTLTASTTAREVVEIDRSENVVWRLRGGRSGPGLGLSLRPVAATRR